MYRVVLPPGQLGPGNAPAAGVTCQFWVTVRFGNVPTVLVAGGLTFQPAGGVERDADVDQRRMPSFSNRRSTVIGRPGTARFRSEPG